MNKHRWQQRQQEQLGQQWWWQWQTTNATTKVERVMGPTDNDEKGANDRFLEAATVFFLANKLKTLNTMSAWCLHASTCDNDSNHCVSTAMVSIRQGQWILSS
jgi:hypothetical protein